MTKPAEGIVETMSPWTIKAISSTAKEAIIEAARMDKVNIGEWIALAAAEKINGANRDVGPVEHQSDNRVGFPGTPMFSNSAEAIDKAVALASLTPGVDSPMLRTARAHVRQFLLSQRVGGAGKGKHAQLETDAD